MQHQAMRAVSHEIVGGRLRSLDHRCAGGARRRPGIEVLRRRPRRRDRRAWPRRIPWAFAFVPDGRMLVTERPGRLRVITRDGKLSPPVAGVPRVFAASQGGLHDVVLDRGFATNRTIYFCYAEPATGGGRTSLASARLVDESAPRLDDLKVIFRQEARSRAAIISAAASCRRRTATCSSHGRSLRPAQRGAEPRQSYRQDRPHRARRRGAAGQSVRRQGRREAGNLELRPPQPQGAALHPVTGKLWMHEHGPRGGDEINIPEAGKNYGWPVIGYGIDYSGAKIHAATQRAGMEQPVWHWVPSIAPSGMAFYAGSMFAAWRGNLFVGALARNSCAPRSRRRQGDQGGAAAAGPARAHPRRARRARRRNLARDRQCRGTILRVVPAK